MTVSAEALPSGSELTLENMTREQFIDAIDTDLALRMDYQHNYQDPKYARIEALLNGEEPQGSANPQGAQDQGQDANPQGTALSSENTAISIKIDPKLFGTYLVNRTPEEALEALRVGKIRADVYIENQKGHITSLEKSTLELRRQLDEATRRAAAQQMPVSAPVSQVPAAELESINVDELKELDPFDPDTQRKLIEAIGALQKQALAPRVQATQESTSVQPAPPAQQSGVDPVQQKLFEESDKRLMQELQYNNPELYTARDIMEIDRDVANAYAKMQQLGGNANLYFSQTPAGELFQKQCTEQGVTMPEEFGTWYTVMSIREQRQADLAKIAENLNTRKGTNLSMYDVADTPNYGYTDYYKRSSPAQSVNTPVNKLQGVIEKHKLSQAAATLPEDVVPEIPSNMGQPISDISSWTVDMMKGHLNSKDYKDMTREEAAASIEILKLVGETPPAVLVNKLK